MLMNHPAIREAGTVNSTGRQPRAKAEESNLNGSIAVGNPYPLDDLGKAARRMAAKSANRLSDRRVARDLRALGRLLRTERQCKLKLGDVLVVLFDRHKLRPIDVAREVKERANHLSEMYYVSRMFPGPARLPHIPYTHYWMAMRTVRKFKGLKLGPVATLSEIAAHGFTQHRQVTAHFAAKLRDHESQLALVEAAKKVTGGWCDRCYHARFQTLIDVFPNGSIKVIHADPPYANYRRVADGRYSGGSLTRTESDSATAVEAIAATVDLLRDWGPKLKVGGVLLLWQAAGPLRPPIAGAVEQFGWQIESVVIWDKGHIQAGNFEMPYSTQCEWLWVLKRNGDRLINHDNSRRGDILRFAPVHQAAETADHSHAFQKPVELCEFLIGKHCYEGELIFDPFGCTGTMCVAALQLGRRWVYAESNLTNFQIGNQHIARAVAASQKAAG